MTTPNPERRLNWGQVDEFTHDLSGALRGTNTVGNSKPTLNADDDSITFLQHVTNWLRATGWQITKPAPDPTAAQESAYGDGLVRAFTEAVRAAEQHGPEAVTAIRTEAATWGVQLPVESRPWQPEDGDRRCQRCGGPNPVWHAPDRLWNHVVGGDPDREAGGVLCPSCFADRVAQLVEQLVTRGEKHCPGCECIHTPCGYVIGSPGCVDAHEREARGEPEHDWTMRHSTNRDVTEKCPPACPQRLWREARPG